MNEVTLYDKIQNPMQAVEEMGSFLARSGMFGCETEAQGKVVALTCMVQRLDPVTFARTYDIIKGKLAKKADAMLAEFQAGGGRHEWLESTGEVCRAKFWHPEIHPKPFEVTVTLAELKDNGVALGNNGKLKDNYRKHPRQMLRARAVSEGVRAIMPSVVAGIYTPEEVSDFAPDRAPVDVQPVQSRPLLQQPANGNGNAPELEPAPDAANETERQALADTIHNDLEERGLLDAAIGFLNAHGWLTDGKGIHDLTLEHLRNIDARYSAFAEKVRSMQKELNHEHATA